MQPECESGLLGVVALVVVGSVAVFGACSNPLPAGMIACADFEDGGMEGFSSLLCVNSGENAHTGLRSLKSDHALGTIGASRGFAARSEFYFQYWLYTAPTWVDKDGRPLGLKWLRINYEGTGRTVGLNIWWGGDGGCQWSAYDYPCTLGHWTGSEYKRAPYFTCQQREMGGWVKLAVYCKANTPGANDGIFRIWMDDGEFDPAVKTPNFESTSFCWASEGEASFWKISAPSNAGSLPDRSGCVNYTDDYEIWAGMPGVAGPEPTVPAAPVGLKIKE